MTRFPAYFQDTEKHAAPQKCRDFDAARTRLVRAARAAQARGESIEDRFYVFDAEISYSLDAFRAAL